MFPISVFTKPWKSIPLGLLAQKAAGLGLDGVELPVRPGFQVEPDRAENELPRAAKLFGEHGLRIFSVASVASEPVIAACAAAQVPLIRIMFRLEKSESYREAEARARKALDEAARLAEAYGVKIGVQNHSNRFIPQSSMGLRHLLEDYNPRFVSAVWDIAHNALNGEDEEKGINLVAPMLGMVNLKNVYRYRSNGWEAEHAEWKQHWTTGRHGFASWPKALRALAREGYQGVLCLNNEYSDEHRTDQLLAEDLGYLRGILTSQQNAAPD